MTMETISFNHNHNHNNTSIAHALTPKRQQPQQSLIPMYASTMITMKVKHRYFYHPIPLRAITCSPISTTPILQNRRFEYPSARGNHTFGNYCYIYAKLHIYRRATTIPMILLFQLDNNDTKNGYFTKSPIPFPHRVGKDCRARGLYF